MLNVSRVARSRLNESVAFSTVADRHVDVLIIGGGAIGTSVAYHLARDGCDEGKNGVMHGGKTKKKILLVEKASLTHGCTWHAAGLVGQLRSKKNLTQLMQNSVAVFDRLHQETGQDISWKKVGSLRIASSPERWSEIRQTVTQAKSFGFNAHLVSMEEAKRQFPFLDLKGVEGAAYIPSDGYVDPYSLTMAYAKGARMYGASIEEGVTVTEIIMNPARNKALGVRLMDGSEIRCETLVNCAGLWAKKVGEMAGVELACGIVEHQYFLTEKTLSLPPNLTTLRDPDNNFYLKPDTGSFAIGGWEKGSVGFYKGMPPFSFGRTLLEPNMERLEKFASLAAQRLPVLNEVGIQTIINGPIPVSADGEPLIGVAPGVSNFFIACGFTAGIAASGGAGLAVSNLVLHGDAGMDLWPFDVRRFGQFHAQPEYLERKAIEAYGSYYQLKTPNGADTSKIPPLRLSPLYYRLKEMGAVNGERYGWQRPNWFMNRSLKGRETWATLTAGAFETKPGYFAEVRAEAKAIREKVALIDQSSFAKFEIVGPGALAALEALASNKLSGPAGRAIYTQFCNSKGGIEADVTIVHLTDDLCYMITGAGFGIRDSGWLKQHLPPSIAVNDVTSKFATINLCGPRAREVLEACTLDDVSNDFFPFLTARYINVGLCRVMAVRIGYVGELGYELYAPHEFAVGLYSTLWEAGQSFGIVNAGYKAIDSCRLEKGYVYWSGDVSPDYNPYEAGLGFCVDLTKDFVGSQALQEIKMKPLKQKLCSFSVDGFAPFHGGEAIILNDKVVGYVTSAGFGHALQKTIAFGYVPTSVADKKDFTIEAFGNPYPVTRGPRVLYDSKQLRLKC